MTEKVSGKIIGLLSINKSVLCAKAAKWRFDPPFGGLRGNIRALSISGWKARDRLPIK